MFRSNQLLKFATGRLSTKVLSSVSPRAFTLVHKSIFNHQIKYFSNDSHGDFGAKKKDIPTDMKEVLKLIKQQVEQNDVMLYMKGTPSKPQCGFSSQTVRVLNAVGTDFSSVNVLEYQAIREGIKEYSQWPTVPQLFIKGTSIHLQKSLCDFTELL